MLLPQIIEFLSELIWCSETIQFSGSISLIIGWIDQIFLRTAVLDFSKLTETIDQFEFSKKLTALSFVLSFFSSDIIVNPILELSVNNAFLSQLSNSLGSDDFQLAQKIVAFLKILILYDRSLPQILPPIHNSEADFLSCIPLTWLSESEGSTSLTSYENDAISRLALFPHRYEGDNSLLFSNLILLFSKFPSLPVQYALSLTQLIALFIAAAPDLICLELADAYQHVLNSYSDVTSFEIPKGELKDSPELRACILTELGKEVYATFMVSEKQKAKFSSSP